MKANDKWKFAIGTTSRVPNSNLHYLIADFDGIDQTLLSEELEMELATADNIIIQGTPHGWHLFTDKKMSFGCLVETLKAIRADPAWIEIGKQRGYYFLADKTKLVLPWPVEHMVIHHDQEKTHNSKKS